MRLFFAVVQSRRGRDCQPIIEQAYIVDVQTTRALITTARHVIPLSYRLVEERPKQFPRKAQ
jgi:hypothetical protein